MHAKKKKKKKKKLRGLQLLDPPLRIDEDRSEKTEDRALIYHIFVHEDDSITVVLRS